MGWFSKKPKTPAAAPVMPKYRNSDFHWVRLEFDDDQQAQQRAKEYVHRQVTDFRTTKEAPVRWSVRTTKDGVGLYVGRTLMLEVSPEELMRGIMARAEAMGAPLILEGHYMWDYKAGPFGARLFLPKDPASVEMVPVP